MSSIITLTWDPLNEGVRRRDWDPFCQQHSLELNLGNGAWYAGSGDGRVEVTYLTKRSITFRCGTDAGWPLATRLALTLLRCFGGAMAASPEITALLAQGFSVADRLCGALAGNSWSGVQAVIADAAEADWPVT
jgi:hypothetical protein